MPAVARLIVPEAPHPAVTRIAALLEDFSLEALRPGADEIAALKGTVPAATRVYLSSIPGRPFTETIEAARRLRAAGFQPVPHLAVRNIASAAELDEFLSKLAALAGVRCALVIAGDRERAAGPYGSALELIDSGLLQRHGIHEIGIAGYPEGHPRIPPLVLERALAAKLEATAQTGLKAHIVTQFCFDAAAVIDFITRLRDRGFEQRVRIGMAGPADLSTLLRYARRCGVHASMAGLARHAGLLKRLVGVTTPDGLIRPLAEAMATGRLGQVGAHFYSFGGIAPTGRWAAAAQAGRIVLDRPDGFRVAPP